MGKTIRNGYVAARKYGWMSGRPSHSLKVGTKAAGGRTSAKGEIPTASPYMKTFNWRRSAPREAPSPRNSGNTAARARRYVGAQSTSGAIAKRPLAGGHPRATPAPSVARASESSMPQMRATLVSKGFTRARGKAETNSNVAAPTNASG